MDTAESSVRSTIMADPPRVPLEQLDPSIQDVLAAAKEDLQKGPVVIQEGFDFEKACAALKDGLPVVIIPANSPPPVPMARPETKAITKCLMQCSCVIPSLFCLQ